MKVSLENYGSDHGSAPPSWVSNCLLIFAVSPSGGVRILFEVTKGILTTLSNRKGQF